MCCVRVCCFVVFLLCDDCVLCLLCCVLLLWCCIVEFVDGVGWLLVVLVRVSVYVCR